MQPTGGQSPDCQSQDYYYILLILTFSSKILIIQGITVLNGISVL
nr:MAG TPA: hypothetical protein [Caudoviricetes sp.]